MLYKVQYYEYLAQESVVQFAFHRYRYFKTVFQITRVFKYFNHILVNYKKYQTNWCKIYIRFFSTSRWLVGGWWYEAVPILCMPMFGYQGFGLAHAWPLSRPNLSYMLPCPITFWFSVARLRNTLFIEETWKYIIIHILAVLLLCSTDMLQNDI